MTVLDNSRTATKTPKTNAERRIRRPELAEASERLTQGFKLEGKIDDWNAGSVDEGLEQELIATGRTLSLTTGDNNANKLDVIVIGTPLPTSRVIKATITSEMSKFHIVADGSKVLADIVFTVNGVTADTPKVIDIEVSIAENGETYVEVCNDGKVLESITIPST